MFRFAQNKRQSATNFHNDMQKLWQDNSEAVVQLINHAVAQTDSAYQWGITLSNNQQKIANGIIFYCGEKEQVSNLFNQFIQYIGQAIDVFVWKKNVGKFRERWCLKADELSNLLNSLNQWNVRGYFYKQIFLVESLIKSFMKRDVEAVKFYRQELLKNNLSLSIILTNGIISDNAKSFI